MNLKTHVPWMVALLMLVSNTAAATPSPHGRPDALTVDLSQFKEGDVVLQGALVDGACAYPDVSAIAQPFDGAIVLRGTDACQIVHAGLAPVGDACVQGPDVPEPLPAAPYLCAGGQGQPTLDPALGCFREDGVIDPCIEDPKPIAVSAGDEDLGIEIAATHCLNRNLNSQISSGPTSVGVQMNYREHCNAGARVNSWTSWCSWNSGQGWRNRYFAYGGGWNYNVAWRWTECGFDHRHGGYYDAYHYMGTEVDGNNYNSDYCSYWWSWNPHTNYVTYSCWYS